MASFPRLIVVLLLILAYWLPAQQSPDSLKARLQKTTSDTARISLLVQLSEVCDLNELLVYTNRAIEESDRLLKTAPASLRPVLLNKKALAYNNACFYYMNIGDYSNALKQIKQSLAIREQMRDKAGVAAAFNNLAGTYIAQGKADSAIGYFEKSLRISEELNSKKGIITSYNNLADAYGALGDVPKAIDYETRVLRLSEEINDKNGISTALNNLGNFHMNEGELQKALDYFLRGTALSEEIGLKDHVAYSLINVGKIYSAMGRGKEAMDCFSKSYEMLEGSGDTYGIASVLTFMGNAYRRMHDNGKALEYCLRGLAMQKRTGRKSPISSAYESVGITYFEMKNYKLAAAYTDSSLTLSRETGYPDFIRNAEQTMSRIDSAEGDFKGAYFHFQQFLIYRDSVSNEKTHRAYIRNQLKYDYEKKEAVMQEKQIRERALAAEQSRIQRIVIAAVIAGLVLVIAFAAFMYKTLRTTRSQKLIIELKQKEILDSIQYAQRIQSALMPNEKFIDRELKRLNKKQS